MLSEEEKKAIEYWKRDIELYHYNTQLASEHYAQIILNLIEQQQKEIECLNVIHESYKEMVEENNYISKDKIKAKIELIKNDCKKCRFTGFCKDLLKNNQCSQGKAIKVLNELLEEKNDDRFRYITA